MNSAASTVNRGSTRGTIPGPLNRGRKPHATRFASGRRHHGRERIGRRLLYGRILGIERQRRAPFGTEAGKLAVELGLEAVPPSDSPGNFNGCAACACVAQPVEHAQERFRHLEHLAGPA